MEKIQFLSFLVAIACFLTLSIKKSLLDFVVGIFRSVILVTYLMSPSL